MVKAFIDTNILLDFLLPDREPHPVAREVFNLIEEHKIEALLTTQSMLDAAYIGRHAKGNFLPTFRETMLYYLKRTNVSYIDAFSVSDALNDPNPDIEDNAQISCALSEGCDVFLTNDKGVLSRKTPSPMLIMTPAAFLARCRA